MSKKLYQIKFNPSSSTTASAFASAFIERFAAFGGVDYVYPLTVRDYDVFATFCLSGTNTAELCFTEISSPYAMGFGVCGKSIQAFQSPYVGFSNFTNATSTSGCLLNAVTDDSGKLIALFIETYGNNGARYDNAVFFYRENDSLTLSLNRIEVSSGSIYASAIVDSACGDDLNLQSGRMLDMGMIGKLPAGKVIKADNIHSDSGFFYYYKREFPVNMKVGAITSIHTALVQLKIIVDGQKYCHFGGYQWMPYDEIITETYNL